MKYSLVLCILAILFSCSDKDSISYTAENDLQGVWLLVAQYADPGDGSGNFRKVDSDKTIQFFADGTFIVNGSLCLMTVDSGSESNGTYTVVDELTEFSAENYLTQDRCEFEDSKVFIQFEKSNLILSYLCIEGCAQKYTKVSSR